MKCAPWVVVVALVLAGCGGATSEKMEEAKDAVVDKAGDAASDVQAAAAAGLDAVKEQLTEQASGLEGQLREFKELAAKANNDQVNELLGQAEMMVVSIKERVTTFADAQDPQALAAKLGEDVAEVNGLFAKIKDLLAKLIPGM